MKRKFGKAKHIISQVKQTKKVFFFTAIIAVFFLSFSCKKSKETTVSGTVVDATNNNPVPYATIFLISDASNIFSGSNSGTSLNNDNTYYADGDGNFSFTFDAEKDLMYSIAPDKAKYFKFNNQVYTNYSNTYDISKYSKNNIKMSIKPKSFIKVHAVKTDTKSKFLSILYARFDVYNKDTTFFLNELLGNQNNSIYWYIYYLDNSSKKIDNSYFCPALDTLTININY